MGERLKDAFRVLVAHGPLVAGEDGEVLEGWRACGAVALGLAPHREAEPLLPASEDRVHGGALLLIRSLGILHLTAIAVTVAPEVEHDALRLGLRGTNNFNTW
jgi:hypothetical protein